MRNQNGDWRWWVIPWRAQKGTVKVIILSFFLNSVSVTSFCLLYEKLQSLWFVRLWCVYFSIFTLYFSKTFTQSIFIYLISPFCYWCWKIHSREEKAGIADERKTLLDQCPWAEERRRGRSPQEESLAVTRSVGGSSIMFGKNDSAGTQMQVEKWILTVVRAFKLPYRLFSFSTRKHNYD